jgi:hypothetical protein
MSQPSYWTAFDPESIVAHGGGEPSKQRRTGLPVGRFHEGMLNSRSLLIPVVRRTSFSEMIDLYRFAILITGYQRMQPASSREFVPMYRRQMLGIAGAVSAYTLTSQAQTNQAEEPPVQGVDPWVGVYLKFARYDAARIGQFGEAQTITISKDRDGYCLSKPYANAHFNEKSKGVLSDREGGLGKIYFGSVEYADGKKESILRVEFCYENFFLYQDAVDENVKSSQPADK